MFRIMTTPLLSFAAALTLIVSTDARAAKFANPFTEFELPPQWQCNLEGAEWVCQSTSDSKKKDAIIVLAAKIASGQDNLDAYLTFLKAPKTWTGPQGKSVKSEPKYAKTINVGGQPWVDALHLESEIPGFYTRYLATAKQDIGVLITMSVSKAKYQEYLKDFDLMVRSLKVFRQTTPPPAAPVAQSQAGANVAIVPENVGSATVFGNLAQAPEAPRKKSGDSTMLLILVGAAVAGFIILKRRRDS